MWEGICFTMWEQTQRGITVVHDVKLPVRIIRDGYIERVKCMGNIGPHAASRVTNVGLYSVCPTVLVMWMSTN